MNRKTAVCLTAFGLALLGGYGLYCVQKARPQPVKADTVYFEPATLSSVTRSNPDPAPAPIMELPETARVLISGEGGLDSASYFNCWVTNRSSWTVTELRFRIAAGQSEGSTRWERTYDERVQIPPMSATRISFKVTDGRNAETRWKIIAARGAPSS